MWAQLSQWLRLEAIWEPGSQIMPAHVTRWAARGWMCRIYLCISLGALQPLFLLTMLLLCRQSVRWAWLWVSLDLASAPLAHRVRPVTHPF